MMGSSVPGGETAYPAEAEIKRRGGQPSNGLGNRKKGNASFWCGDLKSETSLVLRSRHRLRKLENDTKAKGYFETF